jgi:hypothetical protein
LPNLECPRRQLVQAIAVYVGYSRIGPSHCSSSGGSLAYNHSMHTVYKFPSLELNQCPSATSQSSCIHTVSWELNAMAGHVYARARADACCVARGICTQQTDTAPGGTKPRHHSHHGSMRSCVTRACRRPALLSGRDIARPTTHDHRSRAARGAGRPDGRTAARRYETASELDRSAVRLSPAHGRWCTHHVMSAPIVTFIRRRGPQLASG